MGRVAWHWKEAFERRGWAHRHIGPAEAGNPPHPALFPILARAAYRRVGVEASVLLVHEPAAGAFVGSKTPCVVFSHGLERRGFGLALRTAAAGLNPVPWRSRLLFPLWRLRGCDRGLRLAKGVLLINREDAAFAESYYRRSPGSYKVFRNGVDPELAVRQAGTGACRVLFSGSWLPRKGIRTLAHAARRLHEWGVAIDWLLAGTGSGSDRIAREWPAEALGRTEVVPSFEPAGESLLYARSDVLVLPSFFEGQPLALLQGMAAGLCCIASDCCGQKDLIADGDSGLLHAPGDAEVLAQLIRSVAYDVALRRRLGERARLSMQDRSWPAVSAEVVEYVESILDSNPGR
jgi:glycosyltransferase involved in cell wall biosynthesis